MSRRGRRALVALVTSLGLLAAIEGVLRTPWVRSPALLEDLGDGRVRRSEGWDGLLDFEVDRVPTRPRIVWIGASTVAGVPYDARVSPPAWLALVLRWRGADVEVLPLAGPGLAAEAFERLLPHVFELSPDAIVLTTGHNEYLEAGRLLDPHWWHALQLGWRVQALLRVQTAGGERLPTPEHDFDHEAIARAFRGHVRAMHELASERGVPLLTTLPVSNLADLPPLIGADHRLAEDADAAFARGQALLQAGDAAAARAALEQARDTDLFPHRATRRLLDVLLEEARLPVRVDLAFDAASTRGIPGFDLLADHCHPNLKGQRLMAITVADAIEDLGLFPATGRRGQGPPLEEGLAALGADAALEQRTRAQLARGYVGFALITGRYGLYARFAEENLQAATAGFTYAGELETQRALLALLRGDVPAARAALQDIDAGMRANLTRAVRRYPWIAELLARHGLSLVDGQLVP